MKLIVTGATGWVATEVIRQALRNPEVTSVVGLARRHVETPEEIGDASNAAKFQSVVLDKWTGEYPEDVVQHLRGADACIWCLAVKPINTKGRDIAELTEICHEYTVHGIRNMTAVANKPFRFVYLSGIAVERDQTKEITPYAEYRHMRGRTETHVLEFAATRAPDVQATAAKPAIIEGPGDAGETSPAVLKMWEQVAGLGNPVKLHKSEVAAAMVDQCLHGITKDPLVTRDLRDIGQRVLKPEDYVR